MRNNLLQKKYQMMKDREVRSERYFIDDAEVVIVAFGIVARIALASVIKLRREGFRVGLFRPVTLFPFPENDLFMLAKENRRFIVMEMNAGQMVEDVRLSVNGRSEVLFYGRPGGAILSPEEVRENVLQALRTSSSRVRTWVTLRDG
jgi:2-oxoglutarate ferredoxin oxidoreductase subunit alpha